MNEIDCKSVIVHLEDGTTVTGREVARTKDIVTVSVSPGRLYLHAAPASVEVVRTVAEPAGALSVPAGVTARPRSSPVLVLTDDAMEAVRRDAAVLAVADRIEAIITDDDARGRDMSPASLAVRIATSLAAEVF